MTWLHDAGFEVTDTLLRTPRKTYRLSQLEYVSVTRPLMLFLLPPGVGLAVFAIAFERYLYPGEIAVLIAVSAIFVIIALSLGTLRVHSLALRDEEIATSFGPIGQLRAVRRVVEQAMAQRGADQSGTPRDGA